MKQRRRLYDEQTAQVAVEVLAFRRAQEQMGTSPSTRQQGPTPRSTSTRCGMRRDPDGHADQFSDAKAMSSRTST